MSLFTNGKAPAHPDNPAAPSVMVYKCNCAYGWTTHQPPPSIYSPLWKKNVTIPATPPATITNSDSALSLSFITLALKEYRVFQQSTGWNLTGCGQNTPEKVLSGVWMKEFGGCERCFVLRQHNVGVRLSSEHCHIVVGCSQSRREIENIVKWHCNILVWCLNGGCEFNPQAGHSRRDTNITGLLVWHSTEVWTRTPSDSTWSSEHVKKKENWWFDLFAYILYIFIYILGDRWMSVL